MSTFVCCKCGHTFAATWTKEEAMAEMAANFPGVEEEETGVLCDDCHEQFWAWMKVNYPEVIRRYRRQ